MTIPINTAMNVNMHSGFRKVRGPVQLTIAFDGVTQFDFRWKAPSTSTLVFHWGDGTTSIVAGNDATEVTTTSSYSGTGTYYFWITGDVADLAYIDVSGQAFVSGDADLWVGVTSLVYVNITGTAITGDVSGYVPAILLDGNTVAWFDSAENITKDGANLVSAWGDKSGFNHHLLQATEADQPTWSANGVLFDGVASWMRASFTLVQPQFIYIVLKQVSWTNNDYIFDGVAADTSVCAQRTSSPNIGIAAGAWLEPITALSIGTWGVLRALFNGALSKLQLNDLTALTGNTGTGNMGGITLAKRGGSGVLYSNIEVKELIIRKVADTSPNEATIYEYLKKKIT